MNCSKSGPRSLENSSEAEKMLLKAVLKSIKDWPYFENRVEERVWFIHIIVGVCKNQHLRNLIKPNRKVLSMANEENILVREIKEWPFFRKVIFLLHFTLALQKMKLFGFLIFQFYLCINLYHQAQFGRISPN